MPPRRYGSRRKDVQNEKRRAIELSLDGKSWKEISKELNVDNSTLWRWRQEKDFQKELAKLQDAVFAEVASLHSIYLKNGMATLNAMAINKNNRYHEDNQLKAAVALVQLTHANIEAIKVIEQNTKMLEMYEGEVIEVKSHEK